MRASTKSIDAVAVAILKDDAGFEEIRERGGAGGASARGCPAPDNGDTRGQRKDQEEALVHTGEFIRRSAKAVAHRTKQKGIA